MCLICLLDSSVFSIFYLSPCDSIWIFSTDLSSTLHILSSVVFNLHNIVCLGPQLECIELFISLIIFFTSRTSIWFLCQRFMHSDEILCISSIFKYILQIIILKYIYLITSSPDFKVCFSVLFYLAFGPFGSVFSHSWK